MQPAETVPALVDQVLRAQPNAIALLCDGGEISLADLDAAARRAAQGLAECGVSAGDRVALWLPNGPEWLTLFLGCQRLGALVVAVNTRFRSAEVEDILGRSGAKVLAMAPGFRGIDFPGILNDVAADALGALETLALCGDGSAAVAGCRAVDYAGLIARPPLTECHAAPEAGSVVFTTSGTTDKPKFVLLDQRAIATHAREVVPAFGYDAADAVMLQALPLCGTFGLAQAMATLAAGRPMVMMPAFDGATAARAIAARRVTHFNASDEMAVRIMEAAGPETFASLHGVGYAAFANPEALDLVSAADARGLRLAGLYGMSEVQALFARQPDNAAPEQRALAGGRLTSPEARARVRDPESGRLLDNGEAGELELKGPSMFREYLDNADATRRAITEDGFVRTGDLGRLTRDGFVFMTRMGDSLRLGGFLVSPGEIDAWIERHPIVAACQTVGVRRGRGMVPVAFVVPQEGMTFDENALVEHCARGLAKFKVPVRIAALDAFPVTQSPNGVKIQRARLREMARHLVGGA